MMGIYFRFMHNVFLLEKWAIRWIIYIYIVWLITKNILFLSKDLVRVNIGAEMLVDGERSYYPVITAGSSPSTAVQPGSTVTAGTETAKAAAVQ